MPLAMGHVGFKPLSEFESGDDAPFLPDPGGVRSKSPLTLILQASGGLHAIRG